jgi:hypothetical protein
MAIKGKSKPKARRSVTPGPRPVYVPVKRPLVQRRGFQLGVLAVVLVVAAAAIAYGVVHERNVNHSKDQTRIEQTIMNTYSPKVQTAISAVGSVDPGGQGFSMLPDLKTNIADLGSGKAKPGDVATTAKGLHDAASAAADALGQVDTADIIRGKGVEDDAFVRDLINATFKMQNGLRMDAVAASLLQQAATAPASERSSLLDDAEQARTAAESVFASGFSDWLNAQTTAHTFRPTPLPAGS